VDETHLYLSVGGFGPDPSVVTEALGTEPSRAWATGDPMGNAPGRVWRHAAWKLYSPLALTEPLDAHVRALLPLLEERRARLQEAMRRFDVILQCAAYYRSSCNIGFALAPELLGRLAALGLEIDFDLYFLGEDEQARSD
jgi:hypothetical protein